jgi:poly-gamma-glutamate capsule biosynthesis protein CapA/YwtB (metallophosphatase superfamily)
MTEITAPSPEDSHTLLAAGQALIRGSFGPGNSTGYHELIARVKRADLAFTNFEGSLPPESTSATREPLVALRKLGFNLLSMANNHAVDKGFEGMLETRQQALELGFSATGAGADLAEASRPAIRDAGDTRFALIAMDSANIQTKEAVAGPGVPGINPLRAVRTSKYTFVLNAEDLERNLALVGAAKKQADLVLISLHEHLWPGDDWTWLRDQPIWPQDWSAPMAWKRDFARQLIDAGADVLLFHGVPRFSAVEVYRNKPIFHSFGNFMFHSPTWALPDAWEGCVAEITLSKEGPHTVRLIPFVLADKNGCEEAPKAIRLYPTQVRGERAQRILQQVVTESAEVETRLTIEGDEAVLHL